MEAIQDFPCANGELTRTVAPAFGGAVSQSERNAASQAASILRRLGHWWDVKCTVRELSTLSDHALADVGLRRGNLSVSVAERLLKS